jgi:hypothetical protein
MTMSARLAAALKNASAKDSDGEHPVGEGLYSSRIAILSAARSNRESPFVLMPHSVHHI